MSSIAVIWNPTKVEKEELTDGMRDLVSGSGDLTWYATTESDPGGGMVREAIAAGAHLLLVAGGDGTVRAVAEELAKSEAEIDMGIIPLGTGNLLARNLEIPLNDIPEAFSRALSEDQRKPVDVGWVDAEVDGHAIRKAFAVIMGVGIDAHMLTETDDDLKAKAGWLAYVESLGRSLRNSDQLEMKITLDRGEPDLSRGHTLMIGNCGTLQGGLTIMPDADPHDGKLDLVLLNAEGVGQWADTIKSLVWDNGLKRIVGSQNRAEDAETVTHRQATEIRVTLSEPRVLEIDGEDLGKVSEFLVEVQPAALFVR
ncbi:diacylglycerol/lipid kinase family protein [Glutamicibacter nicotianae]